MAQARTFTISLVVVLIAVIGGFGVLVLRQSRTIASQTASHKAPTVRTTDPALGQSHAKVTVIEFGDFSCAECKNAIPALAAALNKFSDSVRLIWKDFPLTEQHPAALIQAVAARCAQEEGKFWEMHNALFSAQQDITTAQTLTSLAVTLGLDAQKFTTCLVSMTPQQRVAQNIADGQNVGVDGTPYFFVNGTALSRTPSQSEWEKIFSSK